jgi:hypothetical protein
LTFEIASGLTGPEAIMLTIFSTPKPFIGHINIIQRNAIKSWTLLHPDVEVVLFGDEEGAAEVCGEFGIRHEPEVRRHEKGPKYLDYIFHRAQEIARHDVLCYINCDILLMSGFCTAVSAVSAKHPRFLIVGRRWNAPITQACGFCEPTWQTDLRKFVTEHGGMDGPNSIDYFVFPRGLYQGLPPLVIGRCWWDNWLLWKARDLGAPLVDATAAVMAVHQNHDYSYHPQGFLGTLQGEEALENIRIAGGKGHFRTLVDATHELTPEGKIRRLLLRKALFHTKRFLWGIFINRTSSVRHRLGLRSSAIKSLISRIGLTRG